jgi:hypothetical protein
MYAKILNTIGLVLSIVGTAFVFKWGLSRKAESFGFGLEDGTLVDTKWGRITVKEAEQKDAQEMSEFRNRSRIGLSLIALGFLFQLLATWIPDHQ